MTTQRDWDRAYAEASGDHRDYVQRYKDEPMSKEWDRAAALRPDTFAWFFQQREWYFSETNERIQWTQTRGDAPTHWLPLFTPPTAPDPRDPDPLREGIFRDHNCWKCQSGAKPCVQGHPNKCEFPRARND